MKRRSFIKSIISTAIGIASLPVIAKIPEQKEESSLEEIISQAFGVPTELIIPGTYSLHQERLKEFADGGYLVTQEFAQEWLNI